ncbi:MAG: phage tail assembly chaperone [Hyphomicrobiaceae bacterium]|nr:phage tail assembly chaperone [Hyphomicrobiaceae bacterium]
MIAWPEVLAFGLGRLALAPAAFWALSPREFATMAAPWVAAPAATDRSAFDALMLAFPD